MRAGRACFLSIFAGRESGYRAVRAAADLEFWARPCRARTRTGRGAAALARAFTLFAGSAAIFSALLYTERRFLVPGLYQACLNGATIAGALLLRKDRRERLRHRLHGGHRVQLLLTWSFSRDLRRAPRSKLRVPLVEILLKPGMFLLYAGSDRRQPGGHAHLRHTCGPGMAAAFDYCMRCVSVVMAYWFTRWRLRWCRRSPGCSGISQTPRLIR